MIPLKIQIKNFLSYGDIQTIDFGPYGLICLSGKNGHGKSALLDALTWALWGQARKITGVVKSDDNLIRIGQTHMMVGLQFLCGGQEYRVRREYIKSASKPYVTLDIGVFDRQQNVFVPIGGKSIRASQAVLNDIIHLDFDSFCNSAFLRQGQSNEFSKKSPKERKDILASILGLNEYEAIKTLASEKARQLIAERMSMQAVVDRMSQDLNCGATIQEQLDMLQKKFNDHQDKERQLALREEELEHQAQSIAHMHAQENILLGTMNQLNQNEQGLKKQLLATSKTWRSVHAQQLAIASSDQLEQKKNQLGMYIKEYQAAFHEHLQKKEEYLHAKEHLSEMERNHEKIVGQQLEDQKIMYERLKLEHQQYGAMIVALNQQKENLAKEQIDVTKHMKHLVEQISGLENEQKLYDDIMQKFEKRKAFYQNWITLGNVLSSELQNLARKKQLCAGDDNPSCPLCEQNLSASRRRFLKDKLADQERFMTHRLNRITRVISTLKEVLIDKHRQLQDMQKRLQQYQTMAVQSEELGKKIIVIELEVTKTDQQLVICQQQQTMLDIQIHQHEENIKNAQQKAGLHLKLNQEYQAILSLVQSLEQFLNTQKFDATQHNKLTAELEYIEQSIKAHNQLSEQRVLQVQRMNDVVSLSAQLKKIKKEKIALTQQMASFAQLNKQEQELALQQSECLKLRNALVAEKELLLQEKGSLEGHMVKLSELKSEQKKMLERIGGLNSRIDDFQVIASATGKDGIQALLIQDVLPEIEQEANMLLGKLTNNQAQIFIESLRDLKKGGTKETLDINISDTMGMRPYEMFSGGEAFRIDFALRIALSKMLARRAGTSLQTLIIDEGFGSQDEEGLAYIMDAIYKIQEDFAKVIIVSHLPSMKEQFPVQFNVEKKPSGSLVTVIENG